MMHLKKNNHELPYKGAQRVWWLFRIHIKKLKAHSITMSNVCSKFHKQKIIPLKVNDPDTCVYKPVEQPSLQYSSDILWKRIKYKRDI